MGTVVPTPEEVAKRPYAFEVLCRRVTTANTPDRRKVRGAIEILGLAALYESQKNEWMSVFASFAQRNVSTADDSPEKVIEPRTAANQSNPLPTSTNAPPMYTAPVSTGSPQQAPAPSDDIAVRPLRSVNPSPAFESRRVGRRHSVDSANPATAPPISSFANMQPFESRGSSDNRKRSSEVQSSSATGGPGVSVAYQSKSQSYGGNSSEDRRVDSPLSDDSYDMNAAAARENQGAYVYSPNYGYGGTPITPSRQPRVQQASVLVLDSDDMFEYPQESSPQVNQPPRVHVVDLDAGDDDDNHVNSKPVSNESTVITATPELKALHDEVAYLRNELASVISAYKQAKQSTIEIEQDPSNAMSKIDALESKIATAERQIERSHSITSSLTSGSEDGDTAARRVEPPMMVVDLTDHADKQNDATHAAPVEVRRSLPMETCNSTNASLYSTDCLYRPHTKGESPSEAHLRSCCGTDSTEPIPLPSLDVWFRGPLVAEVLEKIVVADRWKTPLIVIQNRAQSKDDSTLYTTGKTAIAAHACRSEAVRKRFGNRIFWLNMKDFPFSPSQNWDVLQYHLLDVLSEKIRNRLCPWITRKFGKNEMSLQDWRFYISDLIHSIRFDETKDEQVDSSDDVHAHDCLLVVDDAPDVSVVTTLAFLGLVTVVTTRRPLTSRLDAFGAIFEVDAICPAGFPPPPPQRSWTPKALAHSTICMLRSSICGYSVSAPIVPDESEDAEIDQIGQITSPKKPAANDSPSLNVPIDPDTDLALKYNTLSDDIKAKLVVLSKLPDSVIIPAALIADLWGCDYHIALATIHHLYTLHWISLVSPGAGVIIHKIVSGFLSRQTTVGVIESQNLKDKYTSALLGWLISPTAFSPNRLHRGDWLPYLSLWNQVNDQTKLAVLTELFEKLLSSFRELSKDEKKSAIFTIQNGCIFVLKTVSTSEGLSWSEIWLKKTIEIWISLLSPESRIVDMAAFRRIFSVLLDCCNKSFLMSDLMNMLRHWYSMHRSWDLRDSTSRLHHAELLSFEGAVLGSCYHVVRAREMYTEALAYLKDCSADAFCMSLMDHISMNEVLLMFKYPVVSEIAHVAAAANEALDAIMSARKELLGSEEHPRVVDIIQLCGEVANFANAQDVESRKLLKAAFLMRCMILTESHPLSVAAFEQMGSALDIISKNSSSLPYYQKALTLFKKMYGDLHPLSLLCSCFYACNLKACKKENDGEHLLRRLLQRLKPITSTVASSNKYTKAPVVTASGLATKILDSAGELLQSPSRNAAAPPAASGNAPKSASGLGFLSSSYYMLITLCLAHLLPVVTEEDIGRIKHYLTEALHITGVDASIASAPSLVAWSRSIDPWDAAAAASVLFRLGGLYEDQGSFVKAKKYYSYSIAAFSSVTHDYPLCRVLSMIRLAVCEMNLGNSVEARKQLNAAALAIEGNSHSSNVNLVKMTSSMAGGVNSTVRTRFCRLIYRTMSWDDLLAPSAATDLSRAVEQLLDMCTTTP